MKKSINRIDGLIVKYERQLEQNLNDIRNRIQEEKNKIIERKGKIKDYNKWIVEQEYELEDAYFERSKLEAKGESFDKRTPTAYINKHNEIFYENEKWIRHCEENKQKIIDWKSNAESKIRVYELNIENLKKEMRVAEKTWNVFKSHFEKDYENLEIYIEKYIKRVMREYEI